MSKSFTPYDVQKIRLEKLMSNIDKPIEIPSRQQQEKKFAEPPDFVRNIMGSSAGAGSGEFHVYRHLRRKEFARLRHIEMEARQERLDEEFRQKMEENKRIAEQKTAKKREKRLKKKQKFKQKKLKSDNSETKSETNDDNNDNEDNSEDNESKTDTN